MPNLVVVAGCASICATVCLMAWDWASQRRRKSGKRFIKIALTGGPCGGKSEGIDCIYNTFTKVEVPILVVPEAATIIGTSGLNLFLMPECEVQKFQIYLMRLQYNLQSLIQALSRDLDSKKQPVLLCDRGLLDGKAYAGNQKWASLLAKLDLDEQELLDRYDAIVHMVTTAKGAENNYVSQARNKEKEGNVVRKEDIQSARDLDSKILHAYSKHKNRFIIPNSFFMTSFEQKKIILIAQIHLILNNVLKNHLLQDYYHMDQQEMIRKMSGDEDNKSPYVLRKEKFKKIIQGEK